MKFIFSKKYMFLLIFFLSLHISAQDMSEIKSQIKDLNDKMINEMMNENYSAINEYYTEDVISLPSYEKMVKGRDNLMEKAKNDQGKMKMKEFSLNTTEVFGDGKYFIEVGNYELTFEMQGMQETMQDNGKYLTVWEKTNDGLKVKAEMWNTNNNPWADMMTDSK